MDNEYLIRYCMHLSYLRRLLDKGLIDGEEYKMILKTIQHDFGYISNVVVDRN